MNQNKPRGKKRSILIYAKYIIQKTAIVAMIHRGRSACFTGAASSAVCPLASRGLLARSDAAWPCRICSVSVDVVATVVILYYWCFVSLLSSPCCITGADIVANIVCIVCWFCHSSRRIVLSPLVSPWPLLCWIISVSSLYYCIVKSTLIPSLLFSWCVLRDCIVCILGIFSSTIFGDLEFSVTCT